MGLSMRDLGTEPQEQPGTPRFASAMRGKASWLCGMKRLRGELKQEAEYVCRGTAIQRGDRS